MRSKAIEFVRQAVANQKKAMERFDRIVLDTDDRPYTSNPTAKMIADQHAKSAEMLEIWEAILEAVEYAEIEGCVCQRRLENM